MDAEFWLQRWAQGQLGFHLQAPHALLVRHAAVLPQPPSRVLVPLCGKTHDLTFLEARGHDVIGVELAERAARDYFAERSVEPAVDDVGPFVRMRAGRVTILVGDFFALRPEHAGGACDGVYDRASLVALQPAQREPYCTTVRGAVRAGATGLLVTFDFDAPGGPPFSVPPDEAARCYGQATADVLETVDLLTESANVRARGATRVHEAALRLQF